MQISVTDIYVTAELVSPSRGLQHTYENSNGAIGCYRDLDIL